jgi:hypothetical protein
MADEPEETEEEQKLSLEHFLWVAKDAYECESALFEKLREAAYCHQHPDLDPRLTRWTGAAMACRAVAQFVFQSNQSPELASVFMEMVEGFKDMEKGVVPPIFSKASEPLDRDRSSHRKFQKAWTAAILEISWRAGTENGRPRTEYRVRHRTGRHFASKR